MLTTHSVFILKRMNSISDLNLFPPNQLVPSPINFSHTGASSIIDLCLSQASATHWNVYQSYLFSINSYPILSSLSSLQHQNPLLFIPPVIEVCNSLPLHIRRSSSLSTLKKHLFNQFYLNSTILSLETVHFKLSPCHHLIINSCILCLFKYLHLAIYTSSSFVY